MGAVQKLQTFGQASECASKAKCLRLPIKRYAPAGTHPVLNIDCVLRILVERMRRDDWEAIFKDCLPTRHLGTGCASKRRKVSTDGGVAADGDSHDADVEDSN